MAPGVAGLFIVASLSLAGMPPFSGFLSKYVLAQAGLAGGNYVVVTVAVVTSFLTLYSMSKIWSYAFWGERRQTAAPLAYRGMMLPTAVLVAFTIVMGVVAQPFLGLASRAADTLTKPDEYIRVVLGAKQTRVVAAAEAAVVVARAEEGRR
jgi:multicomponent Na+:H+ antiporter subunit D